MSVSRTILTSLRAASYRLSRNYVTATRSRLIALSGISSRYYRPECIVIPTSGFHRSAITLNEHIFNVQDEADFDERVKKNATPVVVDFHASWCGPCKLLGPRLESLIAAKKGKVVLAKIDIDEMSDLAVQHGVEAVPTVIGMKNGKVVDKFIGLKDDVELETFLQKLIN